MSKAMEAYLLGIIVGVLGEHVKRIAEAVEQDTLDIEGLIDMVRGASQESFGQLLRACLESRRSQVERQAHCPRCGRMGRNKGPQRRHLLTPVGQVSWQRRYYYCAKCRRGWFPLDEAWGIGSGQCSASYQAGMALLGASLPFAQAAKVFQLLTHETISDREVARTTEEKGTEIEAQRQEEQRHWLQREPQSEQARPSQEWGVGLDAAKVRFRDGWHEVKVGVVFALGPWWRGRRETGETSYAAEVGSIDLAGQRLYAEALRRGVDPWRDPVICLADGAPSNWSQFAAHFERRIEVLDWYHATEHLWAAARGLHGEGSAEAKVWERQAEDLLWEGQADQVMAMLSRAAEQEHGVAAAEEIHYFETNQQRMHYQDYRAKGYPVGSGIVESACKQVIIARARQAGMSWRADNLQAVLTLRAEFLSGRWDALPGSTHRAAA